MATETPLPSDLSQEQNRIKSSPLTEEASASTVLTTIYNFPTMEPLRFESYNSKHLHLPLRRDILHRAVIFEGDATRQGTASTKTRWEVHGSHRKIRPQKGGGVARLGTRQSPMLRGGGKSFGPHPRDFATQLPKKMYDLAWRTALSYRYRKGELVICEDGMEIEYPDSRYVKLIFEHNHWGWEDGRTLIITGSFRENLFEAMKDSSKDESKRGNKHWSKHGSEVYGRVLTVRDVDVKDLLESGRVVVERSALDEMIRDHSSDLTSKVRSAV